MAYSDDIVQIRTMHVTTHISGLVQAIYKGKHHVRQLALEYPSIDPGYNLKVYFLQTQQTSQFLS